MADYAPNFVNDAYATPEQLANQRAYAAALLKRSGETVQRPAGAIANMLDAITGNLERNRANEIQSQAAAGNFRDKTELYRQRQQGGQLSPELMAHIGSNPMASPEDRAMISGLMQPERIGDVYNRPAYASPGTGVQAAPVRGEFTPGYHAPEATEGASTVSPITAPTVQQRPVGATPPGVTRLDPQATQEWRNSTPLPAAPSPQGGGPAPAASAYPSNAPAPVNSRLDALAAKGRELLAERERSQGGAKAEAGVIGQDIAAANDAPNVLKGVGIIRDNIQKYGDKITFGPSSPWSLEMKRAAANYAPGFMRDQLGAIAAADSINKVGIGLAGTLAGQLQGGSNAETFSKAMQGVPGLTTSKEGALAMADMIQQAAEKQQQLGRLLRDPSNYKDYPRLKSEFFAQHPIINPLTGNPIELDVAGAQRSEGGSPGGGPRILSVRPVR